MMLLKTLTTTIKRKAQNIQNQMKNKINENENSPSSQDRELSELKK